MEAEERDIEEKRMAQKKLKDQRRREREERRRQQKMQKKFGTDEEAMSHKIAIEERKLLVAQRKLESIRLLDELLERVKVNESPILLLPLLPIHCSNFNHGSALLLGSAMRFLVTGHYFLSK